MSVLQCPECGGSMGFDGDQLDLGDVFGEVAECRDCGYAEGPYTADEMEDLLDLEMWEEETGE